MTLMNKISKGGNFQTEPLDPGKYDAVLSAVVGMEMQMTEYLGVKKAKPLIKFIFEMPNEVRIVSLEGRDEVITTLLSIDVTASANEKSKLSKILSALLKKSLSEDDVLNIVNTDGELEKLLGKPVLLAVEQYESKKAGTRNKIKEVHEMDPRMQAILEKEGFGPKRETFSYFMSNPNLEVFKTKLSKWTRDALMTAENNDEFPKEVHAAYRDILEQEAQAANEKK